MGGTSNGISFLGLLRIPHFALGHARKLGQKSVQVVMKIDVLAEGFEEMCEHNGQGSELGAVGS